MWVDASNYHTVPPTWQGILIQNPALVYLLCVTLLLITVLRTTDAPAGDVSLTSSWEVAATSVEAATD